ncbi:hypothetical protein Dalk_3975 [Desulfatibacillum aliphaticivorans]|uniref:Uncharacterized protein n=1 Tax=Desulfatibacillum aliphaticivorans TaxID=218208 RepID=B8FJJ2_DESAL|nr:hypothetical protein [Desulfatibacillum aliphaticivorans]ACL05661.1 hypothetical protein Dalk_3975 [Desulfatibacillum aliphaticivorans]
MEWNLSQIKAKVRKLTGRPDAGQLSEEDLLQAVNQYYVNMLPQEANVLEMQTWREISLTSSDDGEYSLEASDLALAAPFTVTDQDGAVFPLDRLTDPALFFRRYPESETRRARPEACLIYGRTLYIRPLPDGAYTLKAASVAAPMPLEADADLPRDSKWGPLIAYGAAMEILQENGEDSEAASLRGAYAFHLNSIVRKQLRQTPLEKRAAPGF